MSEALPQSIDEMKDILDIEGIFISPLTNYIRWALFILLAIVTIVVLIFLVKKIAQRFGRTGRLTPEERAMQSLKKLKKQDLPTKGDSAGFYFNLDEIFRRYVFEKFHLPVLDKTYEQIKSDLSLLSGLFPEGHQQGLNGYLDRAQFVKFAKMAVAVTDARADFKFVEDFVIRTRGEKEKTDNVK